MMNSNERNTYRISVVVSVALHLLLLLFYLPEKIRPLPVGIETFSAGMVEFYAGNNQIPDQSELTAPVEKSSTQAESETAPGSLKPVVPVKPVVKPRPTAQPVDLVDPVNPKPNSGAGDTGTAKSQNPVATSPQPFVPKILGSGEGMVASYGRPLQYPKNAVNEGKEGEVQIRVLVLADGRLEKAELLSSAGDPRLDKATLTFTQNELRFKAAESSYEMIIRFSFHLNSRPTYTFSNAETRQ